MLTTPSLLISCSFHAPTLLLPYSSPAPASAQPLPYSCPAPFKLLSGTFLAPPQFLPSSCPLSALLCFTLLSSAPALFLPCSCPAHASALFLLCSWPAPALLQPCSWCCPHQFGSLHHCQHFTTFFGTARAAFYGTFFHFFLMIFQKKPFAQCRSPSRPLLRPGPLRSVWVYRPLRGPVYILKIIFDRHHMYGGLILDMKRTSKDHEHVHMLDHASFYNPPII